MNVKSQIIETIDKSDKKKRNYEKVSVFIVTINTNKSFNCDKDCIKERMPKIQQYFHSMLEALFSESNLPKLLIEAPAFAAPISRKANESDEDYKKRIATITSERNEAKKIKKPVNKNLIDSIEAKTKEEANTDGRGFLHSHTFIRVKHRTRVQVNIEKVKTIVYKVLEPVLTFDGKFSKPYVNIRGAKSNEFAAEEYVK